MSSYEGCHKVWDIVKVGLSTSNDPNKKMLHMHAQQLRFQLNTYIFKLTTKISHHKWIKRTHAHKVEFYSTLRRNKILTFDRHHMDGQ